MSQPATPQSIFVSFVSFVVPPSQRPSLLLLALVATAPLAVAGTPARLLLDWDGGWRFSKGEFTAAMAPGFDDREWRSISVPHDWSAEEPFSPEYASGTGFAAGGIGWYRKHFQADRAWKGRVVTIEFDGVYDYSEVWLNGQFIGGRPYGYSSFQCDLSPYLRFGGNDNVLSVRVDHSRFADSRWYTGSGIYRNVRLCVTDLLRIAQWGSYITTPEVSEGKAEVKVETTITNGYPRKQGFELRLEIAEKSGTELPALQNAGAESGTLRETSRFWSACSPLSLSLGAGSGQTFVQKFTLKQPRLWSLDDPRLYTLRSRLLSGTNVIDETLTTFGIRSAHFDPDKGFVLNGKATKLKGVCIHHDAGPLGAAVPERVLERRLLTLKEIGVNAIRTSHNPPAPELLDLCDRLGFLVKDEAFDEFTPTKRKWIAGWNSGEPSRFGYGEIFSEWSVLDVQDMVRRDRNHPSVILWSIGNEIDYANDPFSHPVLGQEYQPQNPPAQNLLVCARPLIAAVKSLDRTRPVTAALANLKMSEAVGLPELLDAVGYNYQEQRYAADHKKYPKRLIFGSENHHDYGAWLAVKTNDYAAGQFLWTGADYLGEAGHWPNRASGAGLLDLCGFKKPIAWFRQSLWSDKPMVYLCVAGGFEGRRRGFAEHWNWPSNSTVRVLCYANCPQVELSLNGKSLGTKTAAQAFNGVLTWQVDYDPGTLKATGLGTSGPSCEYTLKAAGPAARIELLPDAWQLKADGKDICHVEFQIVDAQGVRVPDASQEVTFELHGPAQILGIGTGDLNSVESCKGNAHKAYHGRGLLILQSTDAKGAIELKAASPGLEAGVAAISSAD